MATEAHRKYHREYMQKWRASHPENIEYFREWYEAHPLYRVWIDIKQRCYNPNHHAYCDYGGRGIAVCDRWLNSYDAFAAYVGKRPAPNLSLDRVNNDGNYEPGNLRWATWKEQSQNRRKRSKKPT